MNLYNNSNFLKDDFDFQKEFSRFFYYWKFFLSFTTLLLVLSFIYISFTDKVYVSTAKIKIIDKKESSLNLPSASDLFENSKINLENEIEVIKSSPILSKVVENLSLDLTVFSLKGFKEKLLVDYPFNIILKKPYKGLYELRYKITVLEKGFEIIDYQNNELKTVFNNNSSSKTRSNLPFNIENINPNDLGSYLIKINSVFSVVNLLKKDIDITPIGKNSDIIQLKHKSPNYEYSNNILNELIREYNIDGIKDRQLIHKRTVDFVNERYYSLSLALDSIEVEKQKYKSKNNLIDFSSNTLLSIEKTSKSENDIFLIENQLSIIDLLLSSLNDLNQQLIPSNIGIENSEINSLIEKFNENIINRKKLILSAGTNNPSVVQADVLIREMKSNIIVSLKNHLSKLQRLKSKYYNQYNKYDTQMSKLPEKEKVLRSIERNQAIKESLYLLLLTKREEAEVNLAVTEPGVKVIEPAFSSKKIISPKPTLIYLTAIFLGTTLPLAILYLIFLFNNKIYSKEQFEELKLPIPLLSIIPFINEQSKKISSVNERTPLSESFRVLISNLKFFKTPDNKKAKVFFITSLMESEGKTFTSLNMAIASSSMGKKVLLIGADLHNPKIHRLLKMDKNKDGLTNYLMNKKENWEKKLIKLDSFPNLDILMSGPIPPNPAQLLNTGDFENLLEKAKKLYDYVFVDTAPCLPVSDTISISSLSDIIIFVARCNHTNLDVLQIVREYYKKGIVRDKSMFVLNSLGASNWLGLGKSYNNNKNFKYQYSYEYGGGEGSR